MEIVKFAPVLICTLSRYEHFKRCVNSLKQCLDSDKTILYVCLDYPAADSHWPGYTLIKEFIPTITGFKDVRVTIREKNYGVFDNWGGMQDMVLEEHDRMIISEDDNVFSPTFLQFVNLGLQVYENREDIFAVAGYSLPYSLPQSYKNDVYLTTGFLGWGVGIWRDKWKKVDWSIDSYNRMLSDKANKKKLHKYYKQFLGQLYSIRDTGLITGDGLLFLHMLNNNLFSLCGVKSRVRNTGHDGSGVNAAKGGSIFISQNIYEELNTPNMPPDLTVDYSVVNHLLKQGSQSFLGRLRLLIPYSVKNQLKLIIKYFKK